MVLDISVVMWLFLIMMVRLLWKLLLVRMWVLCSMVFIRWFLLFCLDVVVG